MASAGFIPFQSVQAASQMAWLRKQRGSKKSKKSNKGNKLFLHLLLFLLFLLPFDRFTKPLGMPLARAEFFPSALTAVGFLDTPLQLELGLWSQREALIEVA